MTYSYICIALLTVFLGLSMYYVLKFGMLILRFQDALEEALAIIDEKYMSISSICERPLFYDSPEVRRVLADVKETRDALHQIAFALSEDFTPDEDSIETDNRVEG